MKKMDVEQWFTDDGDNTFLLDHVLDKNSVVFDVGGYQGWFTEQMNNRYGSKIFCFEPINEYYLNLCLKFSKYANVSIFHTAVSDMNGNNLINKDLDSSGFYAIGTSEEVSLVTLDTAMTLCSIDTIDLLKLNIEGEEYPLLEDALKRNIVTKIDNIQVQFHTNIENYEHRYDKIKTQLQKTHQLTYSYPFVWENWKRK